MPNYRTITGEVASQGAGLGSLTTSGALAPKLAEERMYQLNIKYKSLAHNRDVIERELARRLGNGSGF